MKKKSFPITNIGSVSLLMIFIVLCMVTFAVLSLSEAMSDQKFSLKMADHTTAYYDAANQAEEKLSEIDEILQSSYKETKDAAAYDKLVKERLGKITEIEVDTTSQTYTVNFQYPINDSLSLKVRLSVTAYANAKEQFYKVLAFQEIYTKEWNADNTLNLIQ